MHSFLIMWWNPLLTLWICVIMSVSIQTEYLITLRWKLALADIEQMNMVRNSLMESLGDRGKGGVCKTKRKEGWGVAGRGPLWWIEESKERWEWSVGTLTRKRNLKILVPCGASPAVCLVSLSTSCFRHGIMPQDFISANTTRSMIQCN